MKIYVLDDEPIALRGSVKIIKEVRPESEVRGFGSAKTVFRHIKESGEYPDVVFSDIEMPGMSGLDFAVKLKKVCPEAILIFVTAYSQYALDAFRLHVHGYILKPRMFSGALGVPGVVVLIFIIIGLCVGIGGSSLAIKNYLRV